MHPNMVLVWLLQWKGHDQGRETAMWGWFYLCRQGLACWTQVPVVAITYVNCWQIGLILLSTDDIHKLYLQWIEKWRCIGLPDWTKQSDLVLEVQIVCKVQMLRWWLVNGFPPSFEIHFFVNQLFSSHSSATSPGTISTYYIYSAHPPCIQSPAPVR